MGCSSLSGSTDQFQLVAVVGCTLVSLFDLHMDESGLWDSRGLADPSGLDSWVCCFGVSRVLPSVLGMWDLGCLWWGLLAPSWVAGLFWVSLGAGPGDLVLRVAWSLAGSLLARGWLPRPVGWVGPCWDVWSGPWGLMDARRPVGCGGMSGWGSNSWVQLFPDPDQCVLSLCFVSLL